MRFLRFSIAGVMEAVLTAALGLTTVRPASETGAGITLLATYGVLGIAVIGVVCRGEAERTWWLGFVVFGWGYLATAFWSPSHATKLATTAGLEVVCTKIGLTIPEIPAGQWTTGGIDPSFAQIGHCLWALMGAILGGIVASALYSVPAFRSERPASDTQWSGRSSRVGWHTPAVAGLWLALAGSVAVFGSRLMPQLWAGLTFLLTCGLLGLVALGISWVAGGLGRSGSGPPCLAGVI